MPNLVEIDKILAKLLTVKVLYKMADVILSYHAPSGFNVKTRNTLTAYNS